MMINANLQQWIVFKYMRKEEINNPTRLPTAISIVARVIIHPGRSSE